MKKLVLLILVGTLVAGCSQKDKTSGKQAPGDTSASDERPDLRPDIQPPLVGAAKDEPGRQPCRVVFLAPVDRLAPPEPVKRPILITVHPTGELGDEKAPGNVPIHAVLVIDNSLSMAYMQLDRSLLDLAKDKASAFIESLPPGSAISVIPLCSHSRRQVRDVQAARKDALDAVNSIEIADQSARAADGFALVRKACLSASDIPTKRVVFLTDMQANAWSLKAVEPYLQGISDVQIVQLAARQRANTWVSDFILLHGIADPDSATVFRATIRHEGKPRQGVRVALLINDVVTTVRHVDLLPGHKLRLDFHYKFVVAGTNAEPLIVPARLELSPDRLAMDDYRTLIVPVVAGVPVVFVDQYGRSERPRENKFGETSRVRRLLRSSVRRGPGQKQLVKQVLRTIGEITRDDLKEARLTVMAGVKAPTPGAVAMLREYVEQGGHLVIAAGAEFDPRSWTAAAWADGAGILPAPLKDKALGKVPRPNQGKVSSFGIDKRSIRGEILHLDMTPAEADRIFKAVVADVPAARKTINAATQPQILARYDNGHPFVVQRDIGKGRVVLITTGLWPSWNTLALDHSVLVLDRIMRSLLARTLGARTFDSGSEIVIPVKAADRGAEFVLQAPDPAKPRILKVAALVGGSYGLVVRSLQRRGVYRIRRRGKGGKDDGAPVIVFAVNGPSGESELASKELPKMSDRIGRTDIHWLEAGQEIILNRKVNLKGPYEIEGHPRAITTRQELGEQLLARAKGGTEVPVVVKCRGDVVWQRVVGALHAARQAGYKDVRMAGSAIGVTLDVSGNAPPAGRILFSVPSAGAKGDSPRLAAKAESWWLDAKRLDAGDMDSLKKLLAPRVAEAKKKGPKELEIEVRADRHVRWAEIEPILRAHPAFGVPAAVSPADRMR